MDIYGKAPEWLDKGRSIALGTVVYSQGSTPQKTRSKATIDGQGNQAGPPRGGLIEAHSCDVPHGDPRELVSAHRRPPVVRDIEPRPLFK